MRIEKGKEIGLNRNTGKYLMLTCLKGEKPGSPFATPPGRKFENSLSDDGLAVTANGHRIEVLKKDPDGFVTVYGKLTGLVVYYAELN